MRNRVKRLLASDDKYKKSDYSLMARIWWDDRKVLHYGNATEVTAIEFLEHLLHSLYSLHLDLTFILNNQMVLILVIVLLTGIIIQHLVPITIQDFLEIIT